MRAVLHRTIERVKKLGESDTGAYMLSRLSASGPFPTIRGTVEDEEIFGTRGSDVICAFEGYDTVHAGDGHDIVYAGWGNDLVYGGAGDDEIWGDATWDWDRDGVGNDTLYGGDGWDRLYAGQGDDQLYGGDGNDTLEGGDGNDYLFVGVGGYRDIATGGAGADVFHFTTQRYGNAIATDFEVNGGDVIQLEGLDWPHVQSFLSQAGTSTIIDLTFGTGEGYVIELWNVDMNSLSADDFRFI
jgi:Ca2+-binding RTX toxin-like protein